MENPSISLFLDFSRHGGKTRTVAYFVRLPFSLSLEGRRELENRATNGATAAVVATLSPGELERFELVRRGSQLAVLSSNNDQRRLKLKKRSGARWGGRGGGARDHCRFASARHQTRPKSEASRFELGLRPTEGGDRILFDVSSLSPAHCFHRLNPDTRPMIRDNQREISSRANYRVGG